MLVLSRKQSQRIVLPDLGITVVVVRITGDKVRLGFEADQSIRVLREELLTDEDKEVLAAATAGTVKTRIKGR